MWWRQIAFDVNEEIKDLVLGELNSAGASGIWETDAPPGQSRITAFFPADRDLQPFFVALQSLCAAASVPPPEIADELIADRDWNEEWKKSYTSFPVGEHFFVVPSWNSASCPPGRTPIFIDPGQAFGTGTHETTQLTLEALERWLRPEHVVFDLGTGSGILGIAASMLGARHVLACDNDPIATAVAKENVTLNAREVDIFCGSADAVREAAVDLLLCNVTAETIVEIFAELDRTLKSSGVAIFSGILDTQRGAVRNVMNEFRYAVAEEQARGEWVVLTGVKHGG